MSVGGVKEGLYGTATTSPPDGSVYHYATTHYQGVYSPAPLYSPSPAPLYSSSSHPVPMYSTAPTMYSPTPALYSASPPAAYSPPEGCFYHLSKPDSLQNIAAGEQISGFEPEHPAGFEH